MRVEGGGDEDDERGEGIPLLYERSISRIHFVELAHFCWFLLKSSADFVLIPEIIINP